MSTIWLAASHLVFRSASHFRFLPSFPPDHHFLEPHQTPTTLLTLSQGLRVVMPTTRFASGSAPLTSSSPPSSGRKETSMPAEPTKLSLSRSHPLPKQWTREEDCLLLQMMEGVSPPLLETHWKIRCRAWRAPSALRQRSHINAWSRYQFLTQRGIRKPPQPHASSGEGQGKSPATPHRQDEHPTEPSSTASLKARPAEGTPTTAAELVDMECEGAAREVEQGDEEEEREEVQRAQRTDSATQHEEQDDLSRFKPEWTPAEDGLLLRLLATRSATSAYPSTFHFSWECVNSAIETPCKRSDEEIRERCEQLMEVLQGSRRGLLRQQEALAGQARASCSAQAVSLERQEQQDQPQQREKEETKELNEIVIPRKKKPKKNSHSLSIRGNFTSLRVRKTKSKGFTAVTVKGTGALRLRL